MPDDRSCEFGCGGGGHRGYWELVSFSKDMWIGLLELTLRYLKSVDRHNQWIVSAFIASNGESTPTLLFNAGLGTLGEC
jgi:hypothetical protein